MPSLLPQNGVLASLESKHFSDLDPVFTTTSVLDVKRELAENTALTSSSACNVLRSAKVLVV